MAWIKMPTDIVRLSAGRQCMIEEPRGLCLFAGGNSMFIGETLLTTANLDDRFDESSHDRGIHLRFQIVAKLEAGKSWQRGVGRDLAKQAIGDAISQRMRYRESEMRADDRALAIDRPIARRDFLAAIAASSIATGMLPGAEGVAKEVARDQRRLRCPG